MKLHRRMMEEIEGAVRMAGRPNVPSIAGAGDVREVADNCTEWEVTGEDGRQYVVSVIEKDS